MEYSPNPRTLVLDIGENGGDEQHDRILKALASPTRRRMLSLLGDRLLNVSDIAKALDLPVSTANLHVNVLEEAGLLLCEHRPASRGLQKLSTRAHDSLILRLPLHQRRPSAGEVSEVSMPIGAYVDCEVASPCGLASADGIIGMLDDPSSFLDPDRVKAQLLWFQRGSVTYRFPNRLPPKAKLRSVEVSCEICSEAPLHHDDWPSDVSVSINGVEIGTWTSPADFGGQRGSLTPAWWDAHNSQYGVLKVWRVDERGGWIDGVRALDVGLGDLGLPGATALDVTIAVKRDAEHVGGLNLFGRAFGNYPQDLVLRLRYQPSTQTPSSGAAP